VSQTFCPSSLYRDKGEDESLIITVSSPSYENVSFSLSIELQKDFDLGLNVPWNATVEPFQSRFFSFVFPENVTDVILEANSDDDICMTLSLRERKVFSYYSVLLNEGTKR
jgi:hypothetical protein